MGRKTPQNDQVIVDLLAAARLKVEEDKDDLFLSVSGIWLPKTKIYLRDARHRGKEVWRQQTMHSNIGQHPYYSAYPRGRVGGMVWLSARRTVWVAINGPTPLMVCPVDGDPWNINIRNLCLRDQNDENYHRMLNKERPEEGKGGYKEDVPF